MTAVAAALGRAHRWGRDTAVRVADRAGTVTRTLPGAAGALMLSWGLGQVYRPLFWITLGLFALAIDKKLA